MGADGCGWVRWGAGDTGHTKTRQVGGILGLQVHYLGPMAGEISPDIMFCEKPSKMQKILLDVFAWVCMGAGGCRGTGRAKKQTKKKQKWSWGTFFPGDTGHTKNRKLSRPVNGWQKMHNKLWMSVHGSAWVWMYAGARAERKNKQKETKMVVLCIF